MDLELSFWLFDIVVFNESCVYGDVGDVDVFCSLGDVCCYLELWYVEQEVFFILNVLGQEI